MLFLEQLLVAFAQFHHRTHIHLVEGRQHGGGVLCVFQTPRDGLAQARHANTLFAGCIFYRRGGPSCGSRAFDGFQRAFLHCRNHVFFEHLAALAAAFDSCGIEVVVSDHLCGRRRRGHFARRGGLGVACDLIFGCGGSGLGSAATGTGLDPSDHVARFDDAAGLCEDLGKRSGTGRRDIHRCLVGFQFDHGIIDGHRIADGDVPRADFGFCNALASARRDEIDHFVAAGSAAAFGFLIGLWCRRSRLGSRCCTVARSQLPQQGINTDRIAFLSFN